MTLVPLLLLFLSVVHASPLTRDTGKNILSISAKINMDGGSILQKDLARIQSLSDTSSLSQNASNGSSLSAIDASVFYLTEVGVGTPPTKHLLLIDTGSSNMWIGGNSTFVPTNSSVNTGDSVCVFYDSGEFCGEEWVDTVTLTPEMIVTNQSFGVASFTVGFNGIFDGVLGLGPVDLTQNTTTNTSEIPTVMDNLYAQKKISQEVLGVFYAPSSTPDNEGTITFGGIDDSMISGPITYTPLSKNTPASFFWGINQSISYGSTSIMSTTDGIVDTGTTLIYVPQDAFQKYQSLTGATQDSNTGLLTITSAQYDKLETLYFNIGGTSFGLTPNGQIWPRALNAVLGGRSNAIYLVLQPNYNSYNFVNGFTFLQRFYSVFDTTNQRVGFAQTAYTNSTTN